MTDQPHRDGADDWLQASRLAHTIIGFHELAESDDVPKTEVQRLYYDAQVYAGGVALARLLPGSWRVRTTTIEGAPGHRAIGPRRFRPPSATARPPDAPAFRLR